MHKIEELQLNNGVKLVNVIAKDLPISIVSAWFRAGSRFDPEGKEGLAHFFEHIFMKRTKKYPDEIERLRKIDSKGIKSNAFTGYETSHFYQIQTKEETYSSLDFLIDSLNDYILDENDIEREKKTVINEMLENKINSREYSWNLAYQALWKDSSMGKNFFGTEKSIQSFNMQDIKNFIEQNYCAENCTFVVVSNESTSQLGKYLNKHLCLKSKISKNRKEKFKQPKKISIENSNDELVTISIAFKSFSINDSEEVILMDFIRDYLANKWISKAVEELRLKKNITYWVDGETEYFSDTGVIRFIYSCNKKQSSESIRILLKEINKIKEKAFKNENLEVIKKSFLSSLAIKFTDPYEYLLWYGRQATVGKKIFTIDEYIQLIEKMTNNDVQKVASKYLNHENISVVVIGDVKGKIDINL